MPKLFLCLTFVFPPRKNIPQACAYLPCLSGFICCTKPCGENFLKVNSDSKHQNKKSVDISRQLNDRGTETKSTHIDVVFVNRSGSMDRIPTKPPTSQDEMVHVLDHTPPTETLRITTNSTDTDQTYMKSRWRVNFLGPPAISVLLLLPSSNPPIKSVPSSVWTAPWPDLTHIIINGFTTTGQGGKQRKTKAKRRSSPRLF